MGFAEKEWEKALKKYQAKYKSEVQKPTQPYYRLPRARGKNIGYGKRWC
jgi:hypothetical protein